MDEVLIDGLGATALAARLALPGCLLYDRTGSTMDAAHEAAEGGAAAGTLIVANTQDAGRGRGGKRWTSPTGSGLWMTLIERPASSAGIEVLSLRLGLVLAEALDALAGETVRVKWPNDLHVQGGKLAGILVEARWRDHRAEWVAIGIGLNVTAPEGVPQAAGLAPRVTRVQVLERIVPPLRAAAATVGPLSFEELARYTARDLAVGRRVTEPVPGVVAGINAAGELMVEAESGLMACRSGSMVFAEGN